MKMAAANVPMAIYTLCSPNVVPLATTLLRLESPNGRACVVAESVSVKISFVFTTVSKMNSSEDPRDKQKKKIEMFLLLVEIQYWFLIISQWWAKNHEVFCEKTLN